MEDNEQPPKFIVAFNPDMPILRVREDVILGSNLPSSNDLDIISSEHEIAEQTK